MPGLRRGLTALLAGRPRTERGEDDRRVGVDSRRCGAVRRSRLQLRDLPADPLLLLLVLDHRERLLVVRDGLLPVPRDRLTLGERVPDVPGGGMVRGVPLEDPERLLDLLLPEELVAVLVQLRLGGRGDLRRSPRADFVGVVALRADSGGVVPSPRVAAVESPDRTRSLPTRDHRVLGSRHDQDGRIDSIGRFTAVASRGVVYES